MQIEREQKVESYGEGKGIYIYICNGTCHVGVNQRRPANKMMIEYNGTTTSMSINRKIMTLKSRQLDIDYFERNYLTSRLQEIIANNKSRKFSFSHSASSIVLYSRNPNSIVLHHKILQLNTNIKIKNRWLKVI